MESTIIFKSVTILQLTQQLVTINSKTSVAMQYQFEKVEALYQ